MVNELVGVVRDGKVVRIEFLPEDSSPEDAVRRLEELTAWPPSPGSNSSGTAT